MTEHGFTSPDDTASGAPQAPAKGMLNAVATLFALTPPGRQDELRRLTALAHGFIGVADEESLVALAKAVASRDDVAEGLVDRLALASTRAAEILIRAGRLGDELVARFLEDGPAAMRALVAHHHPLKDAHVTMLVASGDTPVIETLLARRGAEGAALSVQAPVAVDLEAKQKPVLEPVVPVAPARTGPADSAKDFAALDTAGRRAVLRRLAEDAPPTTVKSARKALDPTRHDADLEILTLIEKRDPEALAAHFSRALDLEPALCRRLLDEADGDAMLVLGKAAGLSSTAFARLIIHSKIGMTGSPRDTFRLVDRFKALPEATALFVVDAMRTGNLVRRTAAPESQRRGAFAQQKPAATVKAPQTTHQGFRRVV